MDKPVDLDLGAATDWETLMAASRAGGLPVVVLPLHADHTPLHGEDGSPVQGRACLSMTAYLEAVQWAMRRAEHSGSRIIRVIPVMPAEPSV